MPWYFGFFFVSGFCAVLYELVWLRLSMAQFGVTTALVSMVLSVFMAGLGLGSWGAGEALRKYGKTIRFPVLRLYALAELLIGISAILVPQQLLWGRSLLERLGLSSSHVYYAASGIWVALTLVPWCACMGATIPIAMLAISRTFRQESTRSFSFLYVANVLGAVAGTKVPLWLIEVLGFHGTLKVGAALNGLLAISATALTLRPFHVKQKESVFEEVNLGQSSRRPAGERTLLTLLFLTGLTSMGMEVVWIRQYTPYLGTVVYAFASLLGVYLAATFLGSQVYRRWSRKPKQEAELAWLLLGVAALLPLLTVNPNLHLSNTRRLWLGIAPFSGFLGFLTPMLVDRWSEGNPARAGSAYAVNVIGCIAGPLLAGFLLLPWLSERWVLFVLSAPWLIFGAYPRWSPGRERATPGLVARVCSYLLLPVALGLVMVGKGYEEQFANREVLRDHTATIIATGSGMNKRLLVNGVGITELSPTTKMMAHLPLAFLDRAPQSALVVCFGMGTTYRSVLSWGIPVTGVELVPSVPRMFGYYHADGPELLRSSLAHVVIDDGRRYLERSSEQYDVVSVDPPPPLESAGSSLLYSKEFYSVVSRRLRSRGILQQRVPGGGDSVDLASLARALKESFGFVRVFQPANHWGFHLLASDRPIPNRTSAELVQRMPRQAVQDLVEWSPQPDAEREFDAVLRSELPIDQLIAAAPQAPALQDDRPMNEYYMLRRHLPKPWQHFVWQERRPAPLACCVHR